MTWDNSVAGKVLRDLRQRPSSPVKLVRRVRAARFSASIPRRSRSSRWAKSEPGRGCPQRTPEPSQDSRAGQ